VCGFVEAFVVKGVAQFGHPAVVVDLARNGSSASASGDMRADAREWTKSALIDRAR